MTKKQTTALTTTLSTDPRLKKLLDYRSSITEDLKKFGTVLVEMLDDYENLFEYLVSHHQFELNFLQSMERIGRGKLNPLLLTCDTPLARRAIEQCIPMEQQAQILSGTVTVFVKDNGGVKKVSKKIEEVSSEEAYRVIPPGAGKISTDAEHLEIFKQKEARKAERNLRYIIEDDGIQFNGSPKFSWRELHDIVEKHAPRATGLEKAMIQNQVS